MRDDHTNDELLTIGKIAREAGVALHVAKYQLDNHGPRPSERVGVVRVWRRSQLGEVFATLSRRKEVANAS